MEAQTLNRKKASEHIGVTPMTLLSYTRKGLVKCGPTGRYAKTELEKLINHLCGLEQTQKPQEDDSLEKS